MAASPFLVGVTGANGFIAAHLVQQLLALGYSVRGTVRSVSDPEKTEHLTSLPGAEERLDLVEADLLDDGGFDAFAEGCEVVMHTASPYAIDVDDPQAELVEPAIGGVLHVLRSCVKAPSVRRVVLTSSVAAVSDEPTTGRTFTEADWNAKSTLERNPYYYSKTRAEQTAWAFMEAERPHFDLVAINPGGVMGPSLSPGLNTTNKIVVDLLKGGVYPGLLDLAWGLVDVRDVALAHIKAMETPEASGRYLCAGPPFTLRQMVEVFRENGLGEGTLPSIPLDNPLGTACVKLISYAQPKYIGTWLRSHIGRKGHFDSAKLHRELALTFRDPEVTLLDTVRDARRWGHLPPTA